MRMVIQRVKNAELWIDDNIFSSINQGMVVLIGISKSDGEKEISYMIDKMMNLRIFNDENGVMNCSVTDIRGDILVVSQFTLYGDCRKGRRPSYSTAMIPQEAQMIYQKFVERAKEVNLNIQTGQFQAKMDVKLTNWGPVTLLLDSEKLF